MLSILQDKLLDLLVSLLSILLGGGLLILVIEWRRHKREKEQWEREDVKLVIDVPKAELEHWTWEIMSTTTEKEELIIHRHDLRDTVQRYWIVASFVIRNTTNSDLVVVDYGAQEDAPPGGIRRCRLYEEDNMEFINPEGLSSTTLRPGATIVRAVLITHDLHKTTRMPKPPTRLTVFAETSEGNRVQAEAKLQGVLNFSYEVGCTPNGSVHLQAFLDKLTPDQLSEIETVDDIGDIPF